MFPFEHYYDENGACLTIAETIINLDTYSHLIVLLVLLLSEFEAKDMMIHFAIFIQIPLDIKYCDEIDACLTRPRGIIINIDTQAHLNLKQQINFI